MAETLQQMPETLQHRLLNQRREGGELLGIDASSKVREDRGDIVDSAGRLRIAQQIESRQRRRRDLHRAGIGLAVLDSRRHRFQLLAEVEDDQVSARADLRKALVRDDLKLHDRLVRRTVHLRGLEETDVVGPALAAHERIDVPSRWRRPTGRMLRWDDDMESLPRAQQRPAALESLGSIQERTASDAQRSFGLLGGEDRPARGEQTADMVRQGGPLVVKHGRLSASGTDFSARFVIATRIRARTPHNARIFRHNLSVGIACDAARRMTCLHVGAMSDCMQSSSAAMFGG